MAGSGKLIYTAFTDEDRANIAIQEAEIDGPFSDLDEYLD